jgi:hypothetical protein
MEGTLHAEPARALRGARPYVLALLALPYAGVTAVIGVALYRADVAG